MDFNKVYERHSFINFFQDKFLPDDYAPLEKARYSNFKLDKIKKITFLGECPSLNLKAYEIRHGSENDPRVTLSREAFKLMKDYSVPNALVIFYSPSSNNYRLSLITSDLQLDEKGKVKREFSNPRRYSYFLGPDSKTGSPTRFLITKGRVTNFDDLQQRFSIEVVNKEFYNEIAEFFTKLVGGKRRGLDVKIGQLKLPDMSDEATIENIRAKKEFAVRLIGRIMFCWFLKKKVLITDEALSSSIVSNYSDFYHLLLEPLFFKVLNTPMEKRVDQIKNSTMKDIPFLNGGLFEPQEDEDFYKDGKFNGNLKIPNSWFEDFFTLLETYNFTIDENTTVDIDLSIDPEMLGRIFENLLAEINPETEQTARKATGSYYTPRPIVDYMVDESIKQYLLQYIQDNYFGSV